MNTPNPIPTITPTSLGEEAWVAWQEKLEKSTLTSEQKEQATKVLIKLMTLREERRKSQ